VGTIGLFVSAIAIAGPTEGGGAVRFTVEVTAGVFVKFVLTEIPAAVTGGVDDPSRDGIEMDESEDVDETGEGTAATLFETPLLVAALAPELGANKFVIVGECFLLVEFTPLLTPGTWLAGDGTIGCFVFGEETEADVLVHVVGILFATVVAVGGVLPFGNAAAALACWPLLCKVPTWLGKYVNCALSDSFVTCKK
jgi:hypothetical protein